MVHIARVTPPSHDLEIFDEKLRNCFMQSTAISQAAWSQAQLGLRFGGLGFRAVSYHAPATFISSYALSGIGQPDNVPLKHAIALLNSRVSQPHAVTVDSSCLFHCSILPLYPTSSFVIHLCSPCRLLAIFGPFSLSRPSSGA